MSYKKSVSSVNNYIENKIIKNEPIFNKKNNNQKDLDNLDNSDDEIELEKFEDEINIIKNSLSSNYNNQPKNYGNYWTDDERKIIIKNLKKNDYSKINNSSLYDENIIQKIAKKTERSEVGVKEEIKKMMFKDYIWEFDSYLKLSQKYNIPEHNIKILIKLYLEKYGEKILYPIEIENKILKFQVENIKLKYELRELIKKQII